MRSTTSITTSTTSFHLNKFVWSLSQSQKFRAGGGAPPGQILLLLLLRS